MNKTYGTIKKSWFGRLSKGRVADIYWLQNENGLTVKITNYGGIITHLMVPDKNGEIADIVLGFDNLEQYLDEHPCFGAIVGRYANRIARGKFSLDGEKYSLTINNQGNHLHGGLKGFDKVLWAAEPVQSSVSVGLKLSYTSPAGEEGYPGNLKVEVLYTLNHKNELGIEYKATTDRATVINLTNHAYFNLSAGEENVLQHQLLLRAKAFLPVDQNLIPLGKPEKVENTPFDFTSFKCIGKDIGANDIQLRIGGGYDHCFIIDKDYGSYNYVGTVRETKSGRVMEVFSTEPAVQLYTGNFLDEIKLKGKAGIIYDKFFGFCLETQHYPDSPNQPRFPSTRLNPGEVFTSKTVYKFSVTP